VHGINCENDFIAVGCLTMVCMVKDRRFFKSIMDAGRDCFTKRLFVKTAEAGRTVVEVNPAYASQICSLCGQPFQERIDLSVRTVACACGPAPDCDINAAIDILRPGRGR